MKDLINKEKRAEITTQQLVILIVLIASFIVILFFLFRLNLGKESNLELCHNSVLSQGNYVLSKTSSGLNCHTKYICITKSGDCDGMVNPEIKKVKTSDEVYKILADEMQECWWEFGEGKINYIGKKISKKNYCSICSQIYFDKSLNGIKEFKNNEISKDQLYNFMSLNNASGKSISYIQYLFGTKNLNKVKQESLKNKGVGDFGNITIGNQYFVVMGILSNNLNSIFVGTVSGTAALLILSGPPGWITAAVLVGGGVASQGIISRTPEIGAIYVNGKGIRNKFMAPTIQEADSEKFKQLKCEDIVTLS